MSRPLKTLSPFYLRLTKEFGEFTAAEIKAFSQLANMPLPSEDTIAEHFNGTRKRTQAAEAEEKAIADVVRERGPSPKKRWELRKNSPSEVWKAHYEILKANRRTFSALLSAYYGINTGASKDGITSLAPVGPVYGGSTLIKEHRLTQIWLGSNPVYLLMKPNWVPISLIPLAELDLKKRLVDPVFPSDLEESLAQNLITNCDLQTEDNVTYQLFSDKIESGLLAFSFYLSSYFRYVNCCEALSWELARNYHKLPADIKRRELESIPDYAKRILANSSSVNAPLNGLLVKRREIDPFDFAKRSVGVGINTICVLAYPNRTVFLLHKRGSGSRLLGEAIGQTHVIPAGTFQPLCVDNSSDAKAFEFSFEHNVMREFAEELLDKETLIRHWAPECHPSDIYKRDNDLRKLKDLFDQGYVKQYFLGCGLDLVTLKLEIMSLVLVRMDKYQAENLWIGGSKIEGKLDTWPEFSKESLKKTMAIGNLLPAGAGCIAQSYFLYEQIQDEITLLQSA